MQNDKYTQAFNFVSALQGGVDPRTGLYSTSMKLGSLVANAGMGPLLDISLSYSPVQSENKFALGMGISLGISMYDDTNQSLLLSTGEAYRTYSTPLGKVKPRQQNIENFKLTKHEAGYLLHHKAGVSELMTLCHGNTFVSSILETPFGHKMKLEWSNHDGMRLEKVLDGNGSELCTFHYAAGKIIISLLRPDSKTENPLTVTLTTENDYLKKITLNKMAWLLDYNPDFSIGGKSLLQRIIFPTGGQEEVTYRHHPGHFYPVVDKHTIEAGFGAPPQVTRYHYSENNFLGSNLTFNNASGDADGLYDYEGSYLYWSQATHEHLDHATNSAKPTVITRTYNNFHLMISEETASGKALHRLETDYNIKHNLPFSKQNNTVQFPRNVRESWRKGNEGPRTETTFYEYDNAGNLTKTISPTGAVTLLAYYSPSGEGVDCPASPQGLTSLLKSKTVFHPVSKNWADECATKTYYTYQKVNTLPQSHNSYAVIKDQEITSIGYVNEKVKATLNHTPGAFNWDDYDNVVLSSHSSVVNKDVKSPFFGRLIKSRRTLNGSDGVKYLSEQTYEYAYREGILSMTHLGRSHDGLVMTERSDTSVYTGASLKKTDVVEDEVEYFYDAVGRLDKVGFNTGSPDRAVSQQYEYVLPDKTAGVPAMTLFTDVHRNKLRISYDGLGRETKHEIMNPDGHLDTVDGQPITVQKGDWYIVKTLVWDDLGRKLSETGQDLIPKGNKEAPQTVTYTITRDWDDWGGACATKGSDDVTHHTDMDLVTLVTSTWLSGKNNTRSGQTRVFCDPRTHLPLKKELLTPEGLAYATTLQNYDEMGRLRKATDENGNTTSWNYDAMGRVIKTTYPDGSIIVKEYAAFSLSDHVTHLTLITAQGKKINLGTQRWDGLGRLTETVSGGRKTTFYYEYAWQHKPTRQVGPDGTEVHLIQDGQLGGAITRVKAGGIDHVFNYDQKMRHMVNAEVDKAGTSQGWTLYPSGRLMKETSAVLGSDPVATQWNYSLCGQPVRVTSNGSQQTCTYSALGHLERIQDNAINVTLKYDNLGRVEEWTAEERQSKARLKTTRIPDHYGREVSRHLDHSNGFQRIITQVWQRNNLISERACHDEKGLARLKETFKYDNRNRLVNYTCEGSDLPKDPYDNVFKGQEFIFDALNNITVCRTLLSTGDINEARYFFSEKDPCQLIGITNGAPDRQQESSVEKSDAAKTSLGYPRQIYLEYDEAGRMTRDMEGRKLKYDALGRLSGITGGSYKYDANNRLVYQKVDKNNRAHRLYYRAERLVSEWITEGDKKPDATKDQQVRLMYAGGGCVAQETQQNGEVTTMLTGTNSKNSVVVQIARDVVHENVYTPYGYVKREE